MNTLFVWACWTKHISNKILNSNSCLFKTIYPLVTLREKRKCLFFKGNIAHLTRGCALRTLLFHSAERLKSLFVHANYTRTQGFRTLRVPNEFNIAFVRPTIGTETVTYRKCSQLLHTCLQRSIDCCKCDEIRNG